MRTSHEMRELLSVSRIGHEEFLRTGLPNNRAVLAKGLRMISIFDRVGTTEGARALLAAEEHPYLFGVGPVQMRIIDRRLLVLQGPELDGEPSLMTVSEPRCLSAAFDYWGKVLDTAYPVVDRPRSDGPHLSNRQRRIVALLATDSNDESIATTLGISVRTVRSDISAVMRILGVRSRFSAGLRLHEINETAEGAAN